MEQTKTKEDLLLYAKIFIPIVVATLFLIVLVAVVVGNNLATPRATQPSTAPGPTPHASPAPPAPNPYGAADFDYVDGYLTCVTGPSTLGIDVSSWQGSIDWQQVRDAGIEFVMIRVGGRGYGEEGKFYADNMAQEYYRGAKAAGLSVGAYFFAQAVTVAEAQEEAQYTLELVKDWQLDMPIVYDWEYVSDTARTANMTARMLTDCTLAFCQAIEAAGRQPMVYFNMDLSNRLLYIEELTQYPFWLAMYDAPMTYEYEVEMWQYGFATVPGIEGEVDMNLLLPPKEMKNPS